jgi:hypothetical protein
LKKVNFTKDEKEDNSKFLRLIMSVADPNILKQGWDTPEMGPRQRNSTICSHFGSQVLSLPILGEKREQAFDQPCPPNPLLDVNVMT